MAAASADILRLVRKGVDVRAVHAHVRKPFRLYLCGDPSLVAQMRSLLLSGHADGEIPLDAAACLETIVPDRVQPTIMAEARAVVFLGYGGDVSSATVAPLRGLNLPIVAVTVDDQAQPSGPALPPARGQFAEYTVPALTAAALRGRVFVHLVEVCKGVEIALGRAFPPLRESVASKLTRDAANNALKIALASAVVDHIPVIGLVVGVFASAGDMVAITGLQMMLMLHIEAAYGKDPDLQRMWQLLPVIGGGFGWRSLARELSGFIPVAGIAIKGAIAYAGTIVVGEGVTFYYEHGRQMSSGQARSLYETTKNDAMSFARDVLRKITKKK
jgi:uncharacterized protein (DUF697 family)